MNKSLRTIRQEGFAKKWIEEGEFGILNLCPRFGKIRTSINIMFAVNYPKIAVVYPENSIRESWINEFAQLGIYQNIVEKITYFNSSSLKKYKDSIFNLLILDEIHTLSGTQLKYVAEMLKQNPNMKILGLTGTLSEKSEDLIWYYLNLPVVGYYPISLAIQENVVSDYRINVVYTDLDNKRYRYISSKNKKQTEKQKFDAYGYVIEKLEEQGKDSLFMRLKRVSLIQESHAKLEITKKVIDVLGNKRKLVFCGLKKVAESLGIPFYHSDVKDTTVLEHFASGSGKSLAVINMGSTGVTYKPLSTVVINYFTSNSESLAQRIMRCMSYEYDNEDKVADIVIICSTEEVEKKWLDKALSLLDSNKICYFNSNELYKLNSKTNEKR